MQNQYKSRLMVGASSTITSGFFPAKAESLYSKENQIIKKHSNASGGTGELGF